MRLIVALLLFNLISSVGYGRTYRIGLRAVPTKIDVRRNQINIYHYIMLHAYSPLFEMDSDGTLASVFFDMETTRALNSKFDSFQFCLRDSLRFSDESPVRVEDLHQTLKEVHDLQEPLQKTVSLSTEGRCVKVQLATGDPKYFEKLMGASSTLLKSSSSNEAFPVGIGPYKVTSFSDSHIQMKRTKENEKGIDTIEFFKIQSAQEALEKKIDDWNHISRISDLEKHLSGFKRVPSPLMKVYVIIANIDDDPERKKLSACFPTASFRKNVVPYLKDTDGFLPNGMPGSKVDFKTALPANNALTENCQLRSKNKFPFRTFLNEESASIKKYTNSPEGQWFGQRFNILPIDASDMAELVYSGKEYVAVIGFDSSGSMNADANESSLFFESFIRKERLISKTIKGLSDLVDRAAQSKSKLEKDQLYRSAHEILLKSGYVIPLGQLDTTQYYPPDIENVVWADRVSGFPKIHEMRVKR